MGQTELLPALQGPAAFRTTHWSLVLRAGGQDKCRAEEALEDLCRSYWFPLYAYVRRRGYGPDDAKDLTQGFFAKLLERKDLAQVDPARGNFRSFLLSSLSHHLANDWDHRRASKRGGGCTTISLDEEAAEELYGLEPAETVTAERLFERHWARTVLDRVLDRLHDEQVAAEKGRQFEELKEFLWEKKASNRAAIAARNNVSLNTLDVAIHRLRKRYRELLREEIAQTVSRPEDIDDEIRHLIKVIA